MVLWAFAILRISFDNKTRFLWVNNLESLAPIDLSLEESSSLIKTPEITNGPMIGPFGESTN